MLQSRGPGAVEHDISNLIQIWHPDLRTLCGENDTNGISETRLT